MKLSEEIALEFNKLLFAKSNVLAHIAGASGAGKSTLLDKIKEAYPNVLTLDLDDNDDMARELLKIGKNKDKWTDEDFSKHRDVRQKLLSKLIADNDKPLVLAGFHSEANGKGAINIPTPNLFLLDVDAETSAKRAYERSENNNRQTRSLEELPEDIAEAQADIDYLKSAGYEPKSAEAILTWVGEQL